MCLILMREELCLRPLIRALAIHACLTSTSCVPLCSACGLCLISIFLFLLIPACAYLIMNMITD